MSALLLTNRFAAQQVAQVQTSEGSTNAAAPGQSQAETVGTAAGAQAVAPAQRGQSGQASGQSTSYAGTGGGAGGAAAQQPAWTRRSPDATPDSVVAARAAALDAERVEQIMHDARVALVDAHREVGAKGDGDPPVRIIDLAQQTRDIANQMPDPLPTAPVLRKD